MRNCQHNQAMNARETIGQRIRRERLSRNMTQRQLADRVMVGIPHISKVEAGRESPSDDLLRRIAQEFDIDGDELLLVARRVPQELLDSFAIDPREAIEHLRQWRNSHD